MTWVQIANQLPTVLFLIVGGVVADRAPPRRLLVLLHLPASALLLGLMGARGFFSVSIAVVLAYSAGFGTLVAFLLPARDALLSAVVGPNLLRSVAVLTFTQWGAQGLGTLL